jgi:vacuolar-type H+-ATPase subunit F/Vma7
MSKIAALGRRHFTGIFGSAGATIVACETPEAFAEAAQELAAGETPPLVLVDDHYAGEAEAIETLRVQGGAIVVTLPAQPAEGHPALDEMRAIIEQAAGANILGEY